MLNEERLPRNIVVLGSSAGGVEALIELFGLLPPDFPGEPLLCVTSAMRSRARRTIGMS